MKVTTIATTLLACSGMTAAAPAPAAEPSLDLGAGIEARSFGWLDFFSAFRTRRAVFRFTSTYSVIAKPDQVIATNQTAVAGQSGAVGYYNFGINSQLDTICYNITLVGVTGEYQSPAKTATHIHEAVRGRAGPPRLAFPNPVADPNNSNVRRSVGCLTGPFTTGIKVNNTDGTDTGNGFRLSQIEQNPQGFFADVHTAAFSQGAVRGQLSY